VHDIAYRPTLALAPPTPVQPVQSRWRASWAAARNGFGVCVDRELRDQHIPRRRSCLGLAKHRLLRYARERVVPSRICADIKRAGVLVVQIAHPEERDVLSFGRVGQKYLECDGASHVSVW
jgi:hypothetical protein